MATKRKKKSDKRKLIEKLDAIFSKYIRLRDARPHSGYCECISCGAIHHWTKIQNGHLFSRKYMSTRFDEVCCSAQCVQCNIFLNGNEIAYYRQACKKFGEQAVRECEIRAKQTTKHWSDWELEEMIKYYTLLVQKLRMEKGL